MNDSETQLHAVAGFLAWLAFNIDEQPTKTRESNEQLVGLLQIYETELERQIERSLRTADWHTVLTVTSLALPAYIDELKEQNPELASNDAANEPTTEKEMTVRLLSDALLLFKQSLTEMDQYLEQQRKVGLLDGVIERFKGAMGLPIPENP